MSAAASPPVGSPPQYSPALRWVTTGFGMGPGGSSALSATDAPHPPHRRVQVLLLLHTSCALRGDSAQTPVLPVHPRALYERTLAIVQSSVRRQRGECLPLARTALVHRLPCVPEISLWNNGEKAPASAIRTAQLQSVTRCPPAAYQPGHLPGALPALAVGSDVLRRGSRLDAFSGSPVRT